MRLLTLASCAIVVLAAPAWAFEDCGNRVDDDGDGLVDCCDWDDCDLAFVHCRQEVVCDDGYDDDCDGGADCADGTCAAREPCAEGACSDGVDGDADGPTDCCDDDCDGDPFCVTESGIYCTDGEDQDCDGLTDCDDRDCMDYWDWSYCGAADYDGDGVANALDCAWDDPSLFRPVPEVTGVRVVPTATPGVFISWDDMSATPGVGAVTYDVAYFGRGTCVARNIPGTGVEDTLPGAWSYVVRGENACGSEGWGTDSRGRPRAGCP